MRFGRTGAWRSTLAPVSTRDDLRRRTFPEEALSQVSLQLFTVSPISGGNYTTPEFHSSAQSALGMEQSRPNEFHLGALNHEQAQLPHCPRRRAWPLFLKTR